ncbi:hypothetical protein [Promicromonospora sp. NPDC019610]|uniref:DUF3885 domain-containing protein n=1 Tax=Promicromonospora sp. NPDC019610 TaxID=3364405 RepID=UPI003794BED0
MTSHVTLSDLAEHGWSRRIRHAAREKRDGRWKGWNLMGASNLLWDARRWWARVPSRACEIVAGVRGLQMPQSDGSWDWFTGAWTAGAGDAIPVSWSVRPHNAERWVRFHSLPDSKRYADTEDEYQLLLDRHFQVLTALRGEDRSELIAVHARWDARGRFQATSEFRRVAQDWDFWRIFSDEQEDEADNLATLYAFVRQLPLDRDVLDPLLRRVADDIDRTVFTNEAVEWIYAPYDGGADVIARTSADRDALRSQHAGWLSSHPTGM